MRHLNILLRRNSLLAGLLFLGSVQVFSQTLPEKHAGSEPAPTTVSPATGSSSKSATKVRDPIGVKQPLALPELERVAVALAQRQSASEISRLVGQVVTIPESRLRAELPVETAAQWSALAHRIGRGLMFGLQGATGAPPSLR